LGDPCDRNAHLTCVMLQEARHMRAWTRFADWPLRAKMAMLLLVVSFLPLTLAAIIDTRHAVALLSASIVSLALGASVFCLAFMELLQLRTTQLQSTRETLEANVQAAEARTRLIVDTALDAVVTIDPNGQITGWNPRAEAMFGWTQADVVG